MKARLSLFVIVTLLALPLVATMGAAPAASATPVDLICPISATVNFTPGLTLLAQSVKITGEAAAGTSVSSLIPCSSVLTGVPYTGGSGAIVGSGMVGCLPLGLNGMLVASVNGTLPVTWNDGDTSTISFSATLVGVVPVISASVTSGALQGSTVTVVAVPTGITGNCLTPLTSVSFGGVVVFSQL